MLGHRLVGRQHELLDDLMADVVLAEVRAGDAALLVVLQFRLRHVQFQRPALAAPLAQDHRQVAHAQQQVVDLRLDGLGRRRRLGSRGCADHLLVGEAPADADGAVGEADAGLLRPPA